MKVDNRKFKFINPKLQISLIVFICLIFLINFIVVSCASYFGYEVFKDRLVELGLDTGAKLHFILENQLWMILSAIAFFSVVFLLVSLIITYIFSHRIAGPIYRLSEELENMIKNRELKDITFRKDDYFQEIPEQFNKLKKVLEDK